MRKDKNKIDTEKQIEESKKQIRNDEQDVFSRDITKMQAPDEDVRPIK